MLRATTACNFSSLIWPDGSAPAALASLLFDPPEPQIIGKTQCFATFLPFRAPASSFFWLFLFSDLLSSTLLFSLTLLISAFHLSILSEVWLTSSEHTCYILIAYLHTSSIAQGGGGSSKNRKPIGYRRGWLLWIRDGRAKPLLDWKVLEASSLSLSFSDYLPTYLLIYLPIYLSTYLSSCLVF